tara:strand:+ start:685 stop:1224 length:540 start_codon:yes stop_codon:yes gene_type:complete
MPNKFSFLKDNIDKNIKLFSNEDIVVPVSGTVKYTVESEDASDMDRIMNDTYQLIGKIKNRKSTIPEEKLKENISANSNLEDFLNDEIIQPSINNYRNLEAIKGEFKDLNLHKNEIFSKKNNKYKEKYKKYLNAVNKSSASHILKLDIYDRNVEDNIYIMYYLLSYGVIGMFIFKLLYK